MSTIDEAVKGHTPGPWAWFGNGATNSLYLATTHSGRRFVMDFTRWGLSGAQPRFQPGKGVMVDAKDLLQFVVGDRAVVGIEPARKDGSVYRYDVRGIDCADARLIAAAPELLAALTAVRDELVKQGINFGPLIADADAAIAKATGRSLSEGGDDVR